MRKNHKRVCKGVPPSLAPPIRCKVVGEVSAQQTQLLPEGYTPVEVARRRFAVAMGENTSARASERWVVAAGRASVLEGRGNPLPGEPFTDFFSRQSVAQRRFAELARELD